MSRFSISLKVTILFIIGSIGTLLFIYTVFYHLFESKMLEAEKEKATLIAQTIEPMISMNHYLGLKDEITALSQQTLEHELIESIQIVIGDKTVWEGNLNSTTELMNINHPIKDTVSGNTIGYIHLAYNLDKFTQAFDVIKNRILYYMAALSIAFIMFALLIQYYLKPLSHIASKVRSYIPGSEIDFSTIRSEPETKAIANAFKRMLSNIREYTILLERYKHSVDESSIVSKTDLAGNITYINNEFCKVSGYSSEELIGQSYNILRHPDMNQEIFEQMWQTITQGKIWKGTIKNLAKSGYSFYVRTTIVPILDQKQNIIEYMAIAHDITKIIKQQEQIARQTTDLITGLPNRIKLEEDVKDLSSPKLALLSLDNFNIIKDYYGQDIGNQTLKETAYVLQEFLKDRNLKVYKMASGEFALLVGDEIDIQLFLSICKDVIKMIDDYIVHIQDNSFNIHATAGITYSKENMLGNASMALQHAIETRKESILYEETNNLIERYENNLLWTKKIKSALKENRFTVFAQPIVDAKSGVTTKYECLVRMIDEEGKIISPFFFLDVAKKSKIYNQITLRVIDIAFEAFAVIDHIEFGINLSVEDLLDFHTMELLKSKVKEYDIGDRLTLEIVESEGIENFSEVNSFIAEMKEYGCKISIDDFGTGYSNFAYLMQLNVDYIKVDGSLIKNIDTDANSQIISGTILNFAKQLHIGTVAEFVHNDAVLEHVTNMGFDYLQGFHLGEPIPIGDVIQRHQSSSSL